MKVQLNTNKTTIATNTTTSRSTLQTCRGSRLEATNSPALLEEKRAPLTSLGDAAGFFFGRNTALTRLDRTARVVADALAGAVVDEEIHGLVAGAAEPALAVGSFRGLGLEFQVSKCWVPQ